MAKDADLPRANYSVCVLDQDGDQA